LKYAEGFNKHLLNEYIALAGIDLCQRNIVDYEYNRCTVATFAVDEELQLQLRDTG
jgi:hypothetical protein